MQNFGDNAMELTKRATIYFNPDIHKILKMKSAETSRSISEIVNDAILQELSEDEEDLRDFEQRISEPTITYAELLKQLKDDGKI